MPSKPVKDLKMKLVRCEYASDKCGLCATMKGIHEHIPGLCIKEISHYDSAHYNICEAEMDREDG